MQRVLRSAPNEARNQERAAPQVAVLPKRPVPDFSDESASEEAPAVDATSCSYKGLAISKISAIRIGWPGTSELWRGCLGSVTAPAGAWLLEKLKNSAPPILRLVRFLCTDMWGAPELS
eukprot:Skav205233  [mRNA]  locus=scaffold1794:144558:145534:+ [translate_table: standard]